MNIEIRNLVEVCLYTRELMNDVYDARNIFFEEEIRQELEEAYSEFRDQFEGILPIVRDVEKASEYALTVSGLIGAQKTLKLKSLTLCYNAYKTDGSVSRLIDALRQGKTIFNSLGVAVPIVGSFIQEFIDYLIWQLERKTT